MTTYRGGGGRRMATGLRQVAIAHGVGVLASLLFVGWLFAVLLFASAGVSVWGLVVLVVAAVAAVGWAVGRAAGLIRVAVALAIGGVWVVCLNLSGDSRTALYAPRAQPGARRRLRPQSRRQAL